MSEETFQLLICCPLSDDTEIARVLRQAFPDMSWEHGDSSWDKVRVRGRSEHADILIYRYESPGPFALTVTLRAMDDAEQIYNKLLLEIVEGLGGSVWKPLQAVPVELVRVEGRFPACYSFRSGRTMHEITTTLQDAAFWFWEALLRGKKELHLEGRIPFAAGGKAIANSKERVRIYGEKPDYCVEIGIWKDEPGRTPTCAQVHETVQNTILPAIEAYDVRAAPSRLERDLFTKPGA